MFPQPIKHNGEVSVVTQRLARWLLRTMGWRIDQWELTPDVKRVVVAGAYHTSNWDGIIMILVSAAMGRKLSWLVKDSFNKPVLGWMVRQSGGIFVDRKSPHGVVGSIARQMQASEHMFLVLAPEGTRSRAEKWRTGFYYIAHEAQVPIALAYTDYGRKCVGIGHVMIASGDIKADEPIFQAFFKDVTARFPDQVGPIRFDLPPHESEQQKAS